MEGGESHLLEIKPLKTKIREITLKGACDPSCVTHCVAHGRVPGSMALVLGHTQSHGRVKAPVGLCHRYGGIHRHPHCCVHARVLLENSHGPRHRCVSARV